jgi:benzylsuccinate CoA-transferase BbsF subunit
MYGAASIVAALLEREESGEGQFIDISMQEANLGLAGDAALEYLRNGTQRPRMGNRHTTFAPHGMYRCLGEESWVALACETDDQWRSLCATFGHAEWASDPRFSTNAARKANERALESLLAPAVALSERGELLVRLQGSGVIAAPVHDAFDIAGEVRHRARGVIAEVEHAEAGTFPVVTHPFFFSRSAAPKPKAAPLHGEHGLEVLGELLGYGDPEYQELVDTGVSGMGPPA